MSLLSGIRYVSKSDRANNDIDKDSSNKHHHNKHKHKGHKHKHKHKSKDKDRDREKKNTHQYDKYVSDESNDEKDVDLQADRELMLQYMEASNAPPPKKMRIDGNRSYSRSPSPQRSPSPVSNILSRRNPVPSSSFEHSDRPPDDPTTSNTSNTSVAALLRSRLKKGVTKAVSTTGVSSPGAAPPSRGPETAIDMSFMTTGELTWMRDYARQSRAKAKDGSAEDLPDQTSHDGMTIKQMVAAEKFGGGVLGAATDMDGVIASNILRRGSNFKGTELGLGSSISRGGAGLGGDRAGGDEGEELGGGELDLKMLQAKEERLKDDEIAQKILARAKAAGKAYAQVVKVFCMM